MFQFDYDPDRVLLNVVQAGYWEADEFNQYEAAYRRWHRTIRRHHSNYRVLADCRDFPVQSAKVSEGFQQLFTYLLAENHGHCAILVASTMNKLQARRAIPQDNVQVFFDRDAAMQWLFEPDSLNA